MGIVVRRGPADRRPDTGDCEKRLIRGEKVLLSGFGCFTVIRRRGKKGVNPRTGEPIEIAGKKAVRFKPSKYLKSIDSDAIRTEEALL